MFFVVVVVVNENEESEGRLRNRERERERKKREKKKKKPRAAAMFFRRSNAKIISLFLTEPSTSKKKPSSTSRIGYESANISSPRSFVDVKISDFERERREKRKRD